VHCSVIADHMKHSVDGSMKIEQFCSFSRTHQVLFHEVFTIQRRMRKRTLGEALWHAISKRRIELIRGRSVQLADLMILVRLAITIAALTRQLTKRCIVLYSTLIGSCTRVCCWTRTLAKLRCGPWTSSFWFSRRIPTRYCTGKRCETAFPQRKDTCCRSGRLRRCLRSEEGPAVDQPK
jgi:hypothetical protein